MKFKYNFRLITVPTLVCSPLRIKVMTFHFSYLNEVISFFMNCRSVWKLLDLRNHCAPRVQQMQEDWHSCRPQVISSFLKNDSTTIAKFSLIHLASKCWSIATLQITAATVACTIKPGSF